jgi:3-methyladenine DNA glycosylase Mpg
VGEGSSRSFEIASSHRIGVSEDLKRKLRFFIRGNPFVSKGKKVES